MHATPLRLVRISIVAALPFLIGCNLADYEERMREAQAALKQRDEEHRALDLPLDVPGPPNAAPPDIFFRPPRGINPQPENRESPRGGLVFHYPRHAPNPANPPTQPQPAPPPQPQPNPAPQPAGPAAVRVDHPALLGIFLAYRLDPNKNDSPGFLDEVLKHFPHGGGESAKKTLTFRPAGRPSFDCEVCEFSDAQASYLAACHRTPGLQVVVIYRTEKGKLPALQKALDLSLHSLAVGEVASKSRQDYFNDSVRRPAP